MVTQPSGRTPTPKARANDLFRTGFDAHHAGDAAENAAKNSTKNDAQPTDPLAPRDQTDAAPGRDTLIDEFGGYMLQLLWTLRQDASRTFNPLGFRTVRALLLELIDRGYAQPKDLAALLGAVPPAVSMMIAELTERGLILRTTDPKDGRRARLSLTEAGAAAHAELREAWNGVGSERLGRLSSEERETFTRLCRKLLGRGSA